MDEETFTVKLSYKGKSSSAIDGITRGTTAAELLAKARASFDVGDDVVLRLIFKGKTIAQDYVAAGEKNNGNANAAAASASPSSNTNTNNDHHHPAFGDNIKIPKGGAKIIVIGTENTGIQKLNSLRSDPLMRGFDDDEKSNKSSSPTAPSLSTYWGPLHGHQDKNYKFCKFQECTDASFGSRPGVTTPHAFRARSLLEQLATDPGIVQVLKSRQLVVGTLGEMDPIDDRLMQKKAREGACLLGYNTNHGSRIDVKLRTDDLASFRPYDELAGTLIHELSHNWVGEHDEIFWTNYGQMRVEYLWTHARLTRGGAVRTTAALAGVADLISPFESTGRVGSIGNVAVVGRSREKRNDDESRKKNESEETMDRICRAVMAELAREMAQHRLPAQLVAPAILTFSRELMEETKDDETIYGAGGRRLGCGVAGLSGEEKSVVGEDGAAAAGISARERALAAAEKRAREARDKKSSG